MNEEMGNCKEANTFSLVPPTHDMHVLGSKWVFRVKLNEDGSLDKFQARLVAQGFKQEEGIDYLETYSPVVRTATVRAVLHFATTMNWEIKQMDVKNAFLHGDLTETVYMKQPAGFVDEQYPDHVCLLHKSLYGLKQSPRAWFDKFSNFLLEFGFTCSLRDPSLFVCFKGKNVIMLLLYVDDMAITGNSSELLQDLLEQLNTQFRMKDLGKLRYFLGIQIQYHDGGMFLSQQKYAEDLIRLQLLKRILRYIKGTTTMGISFDKYLDSNLTTYSDSDYAGCEKSSRSTGGFCTFLGRNMISWSSRKQETVSKSSTEAEYRAMSEAASEITWFVNLLQDLGVKLTATPELFCDNLSAVYITANPSFHARTKHFATHYYYVREQVAFGNIIVNHISADYQLADIFTKSLPQRPFEILRLKIGVGLPPTPSLRGSVKKCVQNDTALQKGLLGPRPNTFPKPTSTQRIPAKHDKEIRKTSPADCTALPTKNQFAVLEPCDENDAT
ncbi:PREDICTED: uncharacterized protein LOC104699278 [Camelina sativa]|uniref:Uncharacterized protein LOC104699278 n=1 Tax=Camelina sativa TaxID=90675 RepID=A0ABM0SLC1_CAMSA|nr:PREDICTED: uncharacterized protein LOC104699278 [Camelina sativa]